MRNPRGRRPAAGFSLLEVLFALSIMAVGLLALAFVFPDGYTQVRRQQVKERALRIAQSKAEQIKIMPYETLLSYREGGPLEGHLDEMNTPDDSDRVDVEGDGIGSPYEKLIVKVYENDESSPSDPEHRELIRVVISVEYLGIPPQDRLTQQEGMPDVQIPDGQWDKASVSLVLLVDKFF